MKTLRLTLIFGLTANLTFGQIQTPTVPTPNQYMPENVIPIPQVPQPFIFTPQSIYQIPKTGIPRTSPNPFDVMGTSEQERIRQQNQQLIRQAEMHRQRRLEAQRQLYAELQKQEINLELPSKSHIPETEFYRKAFDKLSAMNPDDFSIKDATFIIENAFYEEQKSYDEFDKTVKETGKFLRKKMKELGDDQNSNVAKNLMLFQFFSDTLETKGVKHLPFKYDFEDYMGNDDWTKMFVHKLLETGSGQCNSLPRLYLILAEEIGAEAFLSTSPNHTYIKFKDEDGYWYNVELTNGMFTADSFILQSGYIKSEALANGIYMENLTNRELMSVLLKDFALGYISKFGYSPFVKKIADKALELAPDQLGPNMVSSNYLTARFEHAAYRVGINTNDLQDLKNVRFFPPVMQTLVERNKQFNKVNDMGYEFMPPQAYEAWLNSLQEAKQQHDNEAIKRQFNLKLNQLKD